MAVIITAWWVYRGLRRGLYPALNIFLVFFLPLLFTLNYYDLTFGLVSKVAPQSSVSAREAAAFCATYLVFFAGLLYLCLWLCTEKLPLNPTVDGIGGGVMGVATGVVSSGVLMMFWFSMPFAERQFPIDDAQLFYPAHTLTLKAATFMANRPLIRGERGFAGARFMRDMRYGLPSPSTVGKGYFIASIPNGLRIFVDATGASPAMFLGKIKERLANPDMDITPSMQKQPFAEHSHTPNFVEETRGQQALVAVIMDKVPKSLQDLPPNDMYVHDGEVYYSKEQIGDQILFVKIYEAQREGNIGTVIALFQPKNPKEWDKVLEYLPTRQCFKFNEETMKTRLTQAGAVLEERESIVRQLKLAGKAYFIGMEKQPKVVMITGPDKWVIFDPKEPDIEAQNRNRGRGQLYW